MIDDSSVQKALLELANKAYESDPSGATRLRLLSDAVIGGANVDTEAWEAIDIYKFIDPDSIVERVKSQPARTKYVDYLELARNTFVLGPIIVTWFGISQAVPTYNALLNHLLQQRSPLVSQPFLYWWQEGFSLPGFHSSFPAVLTLGSIALIDAAILLTIFALTFITYSLTQTNASRNEQEAQNFRAEIIHALAGASLCLHGSSRRPITAGNNLELVARQIDTMTRQTTTQFQKMAEEVLNQLTTMTGQTTTRFGEMADQLYTQFNGVAQQMKTQLQEGDKYLVKLNTFADGSELLAKTMQEVARGLETTNQRLSTSIHDLVEPARELSLQQKNLAEAVKESVTLLQTASTTLVDLGRRQDRWGADLADVLETLNVAVEKGVQLATTAGNLTTQQTSFVQTLEQERDAQRNLAMLMSDATVSVREALADMDAGGRSLRSMAHDMKDLLDLQRSTDTLSMMQSYAVAAQAIEKSATSLNASAIAIYQAGQKLTEVAYQLEDRLAVIK